MTWVHATHMIWELAGSPAPIEAMRGVGTCALCGQDRPLHAKLAPHFTDYRHLAAVSSDHLCAPCTWVMSGKPPATLRMWTLVARLDRPAPPSQPGAYACGEFLHATNRRDLRWVASTLADPPDGPWLVAVAESGQKHTAPFTPINYGREWTVRFDGADVTADPDMWRSVLARSAVLRAAGFSAAAIESGQPPVAALKGEALSAWRTHWPHLAPYAGTVLLHLANYMITKESLGDYLATYPV